MTKVGALLEPRDGEVRERGDGDGDEDGAGIARGLYKYTEHKNALTLV